MKEGTFRLVDVDKSGGIGETERAKRLVCLIEGGGKLAIWGSEANTANIDAVVKAGFPCEVCCDWRTPVDWGTTKFGHEHWVPEGAKLRVVWQAKR